MKLEGYVENIVFRNEKNGYSVLEMSCSGEELTVVGIFPYVDSGLYLELTGGYTEHPIYGRQFKAEDYEEKPPQDLLSIERYLGSGAIKGVGPKLAARITERFGDRTFEIIEDEPERLAEVKGISQRMAREIAKQAVEKRELRDAMIFLQQFGISISLSMKIYKYYGDSLYKVIRENPYRMAEDIEGVGFRTADEIAFRAGISAESEGRIRSGILYTLSTASSQGHMCLPEDELTARAASILGVDAETVETQISDLCIDRKIVRKMKGAPDEGGRVFVYTSRAYYTELEVAAMLVRLNLSFDQSGTGRVTDFVKNVDIGGGTRIELDPVQAQAVEAAVDNGVMILTGGPGTGKTTTINAIIHYFEAEGLTIRLAAPTGRAAKRMTETTGFAACTIHRMLEPGGGLEDAADREDFGRNEDNPLEDDVIIIDEMSMVDIYLMKSLLKALVPGTRLILVGDEDQLPSVGPGCVLKDLVYSGCFKTVRLTKIFRQAAMSDIVTNAHRIIEGGTISFDNKSRDFFFLERNDPTVILRVVLSLVQEKLPGYVNADPYDIQVLTPTRKGTLGVENLNLMLQHYLNPPSPDKPEIPFGREKTADTDDGENAAGRQYTSSFGWGGKKVLRTGDKVMQIKNNYQLEWEVRNRYGIAVETGMGVFNGDIGTVKSVNAFLEEVTVEFDEGRTVSYQFAQLDELELAYAATVHKSQGSEYPAVVIPLLGGPKPLLNRNLIYTAVTRARTCVAIVGSRETFMEMVGNETEQKRYTGLCEALKSYIPAQVSGL